MKTTPKKTICGCQEHLQNNGLDKRVKVIVKGICRYCGTKQYEKTK